MRFITLINLVLGRKAIPELLQADCAAQKFADAVRPLLKGGPQREAQLQGIEEALKALGENAEIPSLRAARAVIEIASRARA